MNEPAEQARQVISQIPAAKLERRRHWRMLLDRVARNGVSIGGIGVIFAIVLIFFYLLYVVLPILEPADAQPIATLAVEGDARTLYLSTEEQAEIGVRVSDDGQIRFFRLGDGSTVKDIHLPVPEGVTITSVGKAMSQSRTLALGFSDGRALVVKHNYRISYPNDKRLIEPEVDYPLGEAPVVIDEEGHPVTQLSLQVGEENTTLVGLTDDNRLVLTNIRREESFLGDDVELVETHSDIQNVISKAEYLLMNPEQWILYVANEAGNLARYDISGKEEVILAEQVKLVDPGTRVTAMELLTGGISLLVGDSRGHISQWFSVRDERNQERLQLIRSFDDQDQPIISIAAEYARKGFLAADAGGTIAIYHSTAHNIVFEDEVVPEGLRRVAIAPRADAWIAEGKDNQLHIWHIDNEHPEVSWSSLWGKVWYESYPEPQYIWQSSSASNDFEPKFSLTPLAFGTLKAAFYAMLIAMPLAILGAIYTAYFMSPRMRGLVKPGIEVMEALPTVILGFLAGLWLAPFIEIYLPGIFSLFLIMPVGILLFGYAWHHAPAAIRHKLNDGWEAAVLIPVVLLLGWISFQLSQPLEAWFFGGDIRQWMRQELGVAFDQRNSIVVGLAMGFAVIPTIFSIAEDAIFNVPRHLTNGSLALGATPWQSLVRVVLLTASPGIFSAVMIGLGRAVGETMIVLMATGNTPVMDFSIFQGMRTLSANIAVEMPESEVDSTHYRVLFLAALVLFLFTFVFNTAAELVRQRLRKKYASL